MQHIEWGGWNCVRLESDDLSMVVTLDVGPRIISFGFADGPNEMMVKDKDLGQKGGNTYRGYGGHRLWISPEDRVRTYTPDNDPVTFEPTPGGYSFRSGVDAFGIERELVIAPQQGMRSFRIEHNVYNHGPQRWMIAPWALTVMATGGTCLIPQEPFVSHEDELLPARPIVLWPYAKMNDPRYTWGQKLIQLRQDVSMGPTKIGVLVKSGIVGYANGDRLFVKQFEFDPDGTYPDYGVNFETFTRHDMLEVESLGTLQDLGPGDVATLIEHWTLSRVQLDLGDEAGTLATLMDTATEAFGR